LNDRASLQQIFVDSSLGLRRGEVRLVPYDPAWEVTYQRLSGLLLPELPCTVVAIEHVGSTAVPGLAAKPILDLAIGLRPGADDEEASTSLERFGFLRRGDSEDGTLSRNFGLELEERVRLVNGHLVHHDGPHWQDYLTFRDLLRTSDARRDSYARLKGELVTAHGDNRTAYVDGKTAFVRGNLG